MNGCHKALAEWAEKKKLKGSFRYSGPPYPKTQEEMEAGLIWKSGLPIPSLEELRPLMEKAEFSDIQQRAITKAKACIQGALDEPFNYKGFLFSIDPASLAEMNLHLASLTGGVDNIEWIDSENNIRTIRNFGSFVGEVVRHRTQIVLAGRRMKDAILSETNPLKIASQKPDIQKFIKKVL